MKQQRETKEVTERNGWENRGEGGVNARVYDRPCENEGCVCGREGKKKRCDIQIFLDIGGCATCNLLHQLHADYRLPRFRLDSARKVAFTDTGVSETRLLRGKIHCRFSTLPRS